MHEYVTDEDLCAKVGTFLSAGARAGQPLIVIATEPHRRTLARHLRASGVDLDHLLDGRDIVWLDARDTLSAFMESGRPDPALFAATVGRVFEKLLTDRRYLLVRAYGEMVDLLCMDGNVAGALELEELWDALVRKYSFRLLCAYASTTERHDDHVSIYARIHEIHGHPPRHPPRAD